MRSQVDFETLIHVDPDLPTPVYLQLQTQLRAYIVDGRLPSGAALPSERTLADRLGLSRMTIRRALAALVAEELLEQRHGSGTFVRADRVRQSVDRVLGFSDEMRRLGKTSGARLVSFASIKADANVAMNLQTDVGRVVTRITRVRTANDRPLALQTAYLPPRFHPFRIEDLVNLGSLYAVLRRNYGVIPKSARQTVLARMPTVHEIDLLELDDPVPPVLSLERTTVDAAGLPIEYVQSAYDGRSYQLELYLNAD